MRPRRTDRLAALAASTALALALMLGRADAQRSVANGPIHNGTEVGCDLPRSMRVRNERGTDRLGLCVWASAQMMVNFLNVEELADLFEYMKTQPGGGWPERVDEVMKARAPDRKYAQYIGTGLDFAQAAIDSGRPVCITYGYGEIYAGPIQHMVFLVHLDTKLAAVIDNNEPDVIRWMSRVELLNRAVHGNGYLWAWYIIGSPPPPPPHN